MTPSHTITANKKTGAPSINRIRYSAAVTGILLCVYRNPRHATSPVQCSLVFHRRCSLCPQALGLPACECTQRVQHYIIIEFALLITQVFSRENRQKELQKYCLT